jgi:cytochrome c oxidase subunit 1
MPMFIQGLSGMNRRMYDGGAGYTMNQDVLVWNEVISIAAWALGFFQLFFIYNFFHSIKKGEKVGNNPWDATTLEWTAPSPPPHGNFVDGDGHPEVPTAYRGPYEYSVPGAKTDFIMQGEKV